MKKRSGCLVLVVAVVLIYAVWVNYPSARYAKAGQAIMDKFGERFQKEQAVANDAKNNAYLDPTFLPFWGRQDIEHKDKTEVKDKLTAIADKCDLAQGYDTHLESAVKARDPQILSNFVAMEEFYPRIHEVMSKPLFLFPDQTPPNAATLVPNYTAIGKLAKGCSGLAEYEVLQKKSDAALQISGDMVRLGWLLARQQGTLFQMMFAVGIQSIGQDAVAMVVQTGLPGSPDALETLSKVLEGTHPKRQAFLDSLEGDYWMIMNTLNSKNIKALEIDWADGLAKIPGLLSRETRLYQNDFLPLMELAKSNKLVDAPDFQKDLFYNWFVGRRCFFSSFLTSKFNRSSNVFNLLQRRQAFLHVYLGLLRAHQKSGHWPATLAELESAG